MKRRELLAAAPVAALAAALPAEAGAETPVMKLFREWKAHYDRLEEPEVCELSDTDYNALCGANDRRADRIISTPCVGPADFAAKVLAATLNGVSDLSDTNIGLMVLAEARALIGGVA